MRKHDLTNKNTTTNTKTKTITMANTFRKHLSRAIFETCDLWDIWSEWWENMTWPTKRQRQRQIQRQWQIHLENTFKERSLRIVTLKTLAQSHEKTWPAKKDYEKNKVKDKTRQWQIRFENTLKEFFDDILKTFREYLQIAILQKLWNYWHFWPLRTWKHYNHRDLAIKIDTGQHSQFLRCFIINILQG